MNKKGAELSLNTIIIAAIVLIVLIVLWAIFTGRMGGWSTGVSDEDARAKLSAAKIQAEAKGGGCVAKNICSELVGTYNAVADCPQGCKGWDSKNKKCMGSIPVCNNKEYASCANDVCQWVGQTT